LIVFEIATLRSSTIFSDGPRQYFYKNQLVCASVNREPKIKKFKAQLHIICSGIEGIFGGRKTKAKVTPNNIKYDIILTLFSRPG